MRLRKEEDQKTEEGSKREGIVLRVDFLFLLKNAQFELISLTSLIKNKLI